MKLGSHAVRNLQGVNEFGYTLGCDRGVGAGESLERLIGVRVPFAAEYGLYAFGNDVPHAGEVAVYRITIEQQLAETLEGGVDGYDGVSHGHTHVAEHSGVGEIALETRYRQLL